MSEDDRPYHGEDFCLTHGRDHMRSRLGDPIPYCAECEREPATATPNDVDFDDMHHALGRPIRASDEVHRNYYCTVAKGATSARFESLGLWDFVRTINEGCDAIYCVNGAGKAALHEWMKARELGVGQ